MRTNRSVGRKLGLHHISLFRGHLDGLDLGELGELYLDTGADRVRAKATLRWVRDELISAARISKPSYARVLKIPLSRLANTSAAGSGGPVIDLEDFRAERDPTGFYTEAELIELFEEAYGSQDKIAARKFAQSDRLRKKIREAVAWLESWAVEDPDAEDPITAWLDETVSERLNSAGLYSLSDILGLIRLRGKSWHRKIGKLGPIGAAHIEKWLRANELLGQSSVVTLPCPADVRSIAPIERLDASWELSGIHGTNRAYGGGIAAVNDYDAINEWLRSLGQSVHTVRSYRKEAERFLLFMIFERGRPMSSATVDDCTHYRSFLASLEVNAIWSWNTSRSDWVSDRKAPRHSAEWKPFTGGSSNGGLTPTSQRLAVVILTGMFAWLVKMKYLDMNPWEAVAPLLSSTPVIRKDHSLTREQWTQVLATCEAMDDKGEAYLRLKFLLLLCYSTGLRLSEIANSTVAPLTVRPGQVRIGLQPSEDGEGYDLVVCGKRQKVRSIPISDLVMDTLVEYMSIRGHGKEPDGWPENTHLIVSLEAGLQHCKKGARQPLTPGAIYNILKRHFKMTARDMDSARNASHLLQASTHWLRHTHATHSLNAGSSIADVQDILGHSSPSTTAIYLHSSRKRRKAAVDRLMNGPGD